MFGFGRRARARSPLQHAATAILVLIDLAGIVAIVTGHHDLGSTLIGLGIVSLAPFGLWMRRAGMPGVSRDQRKA